MGTVRQQSDLAKTDAQSMLLDFGNFWEYIHVLGDNLAAGNFSAAHDTCDLISNAFRDGTQHLYNWAGADGYIQHSINIFEYIDPYIPTTTYELTMLKLIAIMSIAKPAEIMTFICLTDAYHASLWDRPYNPEYFATMVRAFKSWQ